MLVASFSRRIGHMYLLALVAVLLLVGCGDSTPSPQDAEDHVRSELESQGEGINVRSVYCEEGSGERYECDVSYSILGTGERNEKTLVDFEEIP